MANINRIEEGDIVRVNCHNGQCTICHKAEVLSIPQATGESWVFKDIRDEFCTTPPQIHYVSEGVTITLLEKHRDKKLKPAEQRLNKFCEIHNQAPPCTVCDYV